MKILKNLKSCFSISKWLKGPEGHCWTMRFSLASGAGKDQPCLGALLAGFWAHSGGIIMEYSGNTRKPEKKKVEDFPGL